MDISLSETCLYNQALSCEVDEISMINYDVEEHFYGTGKLKIDDFLKCDCGYNCVEDKIAHWLQNAQKECIEENARIILWVENRKYYWKTFKQHELHMSLEALRQVGKQRHMPCITHT